MTRMRSATMASLKSPHLRTRTRPSLAGTCIGSSLGPGLWSSWARSTVHPLGILSISQIAHVTIGTVVATLLTPIGSYFKKSNQASYLGTSYLLSLCCFTPLYGRLSDILGIHFLIKMTRN
jgi:hypothetical protein